MFRGCPVTVVIDCCEQQIQRSGDQRIQALHYSGKKGYTSLSVLLGCSPKGEVHFLSSSYPGSIHDITISEITKCRFYHQLENEWVLADAGFVGLDKVYPKVLVPKKGRVDDQEAIFNRELGSIRIVVENVFGHIQDWKICKETLRAHLLTGIQ
eukprot:gb/GECH01006282.1/.p1 GENE.gb/GECH01006282.1/~~gb/GECH01006282.1/.p1  ORF type:complete len:154 (+),score=9.64 gb/GECH01006282.1/:1-462(+)